MKKTQILAGILESLPSCFAVLDHKLNFVALSKEWNTLPKTKEVKIGDSFFSFWNTDEKKWRKAFEKVLKGEITRSSRDKITTEEDDFYIKWSANPLYGNNKKEIESIVLYVEDITQLVATESTLNHSERMITLGEMAGGIAHEINNPLNIISAGVEVLDYLYQANEIDYNKIKKTLLTIKNTTFRISKIINGLKSFSRSEQIDDLELQTAEKIVQDALNLSQEKLKNSAIEVKNDIDGNMTFLCRPIEISQILINLFHNSRDALQEIKTDRWIKIATEKDKYFCSLIIMDNGPQIPQKIANKMMTPFYTTKKVGEGTGLGLSISKKIAERNNAELIYEPNSTHTCFKIRFKSN